LIDANNAKSTIFNVQETLITGDIYTNFCTAFTMTAAISMQNLN